MAEGTTFTFTLVKEHSRESPMWAAVGLYLCDTIWHVMYVYDHDIWCHVCLWHDIWCHVMSMTWYLMSHMSMTHYHMSHMSMTQYHMSRMSMTQYHMSCMSMTQYGMSCMSMTQYGMSCIFMTQYHMSCMSMRQYKFLTCVMHGIHVYGLCSWMAKQLQIKKLSICNQWKIPTM